MVQILQLKDKADKLGKMVDVATSEKNVTERKSRTIWLAVQPASFSVVVKCISFFILLKRSRKAGYTASPYRDVAWAATLGT